MRLSRRQLLAGSLSIAALGAGSAALLAAQPSLLRTPSSALRVLDVRLFSTLSALSDRVCPARGSLPSASALGVPEAIDAVLDTLHEANTAEIVLALRLLESGLLGVIDGRPRPFTRLSDDAKDRAIVAWRDSALPDRKKAYRALTALIASTYWSSEATWPYIGYGGPPRFPGVERP